MSRNWVLIMCRAIQAVFISGLLFFVNPGSVLADSHGSIEIKPSPVEFPSVRYGQCRSKKITVTNESERAIQSPEISLDTYEAFDVQRNRCPDALEPGEGCKIWINFCPPHYDTTYTANLLVSGRDSGVELQGDGLIAP